MTEAKRAASPRFTADNIFLVYTPGTDQVALSDHDDPRRWRRRLFGQELSGMDFEERKARVFIQAVHLIVRDRCDPLAVHRALLGLEEYQDGLAEDALWEVFPPE
jgi:hypothetical protein